jgi:hypothetical protein
MAGELDQNWGVFKGGQEYQNNHKITGPGPVFPTKKRSFRHQKMGRRNSNWAALAACGVLSGFGIAGDWREQNPRMRSQQKHQKRELLGAQPSEMVGTSTRR